MGEPALPDPGIACEKDCLSFSSPGRAQGVVQGLQLEVPTDQNGAECPLGYHPLSRSSHHSGVPMIVLAMAHRDDKSMGNGGMISGTPAPR